MLLMAIDSVPPNLPMARQREMRREICLELEEIERKLRILESDARRDAQRSSVQPRF